MDFKISSIRIECAAGTVLVPFSDGITFFCGNTGVGKTTLLNLISYALGQNPVRAQIIDNEVKYVSVNALVCGKRMSIKRKIASNLITVTDERAHHSFYAKSVNGSRNTFSDFLYSLVEIEPIEMLQGRSSKSAKISFSNYMWYAYLRQDELDNTLFYLNEENRSPKKYTSNYVLRTIFNQSELLKKDIAKRINVINEKQQSIENKLSVIREISLTSKLLKINIGNEIVRKRLLLGELNAELSQIKMPQNSDQLNAQLELSRKAGKYEAEIQYLCEFRKIRHFKEANEDLWKEYEDEKQLCYRKMGTINSRPFFDSVSRLQSFFKECLLGVGFPNFSARDSIVIDIESFVPSVYSNTGEFLFNYQTLSSSGIRTIFKICYALAIHRFVLEEKVKTLLPTFMMIDTPMKSISERVDRNLYVKLYEYFYKSFSKDGILGELQLILIDKEFPKIFKDHNVPHKIYTRESPLIPCANKKGDV